MSKLILLVPGILYGIAAFASTRGLDGNLFLWLNSTAVIGGIYLIISWFQFPSLRLIHFAIHLLLFELCCLPALLTAKKLDEMAGMMLLFVPLTVAATVALAAVVHLTRRLVLKWTRNQ